MKHKRLILIMMLCCILCGCGAYESNAQVVDMSKTNSYKPKAKTECDGKLEKIAGDTVCSEYIDTETGVHYWYVYSSGFTPRYNSDGTLMVGR